MKLIPLLLFLSLPSSASVVNDIRPPDNNSPPLVVWIFCDGKLMGMAGTSSYGYMLGTANQVKNSSERDPVFFKLVIDEALKDNAYFRMDLDCEPK